MDKYLLLWIIGEQFSFRIFLAPRLKPALFPWQLHSFEELCLGEGPNHSYLYTSNKSLLDYKPHATADLPFLVKWERDLQVTFTEPQKERILFFAQKSSFCSKYHETSYTITIRWYSTPSALAKIFPNLIVVGVVSYIHAQFYIFLWNASNLLATSTSTHSQIYRHLVMTTQLQSYLTE